MAKSALAQNTHKPYEDLFNRTGVKFTYVASVALADITRDPQAQARERLYADLAKEFAIQMKNGSKFPPLVLWDQNDSTGASGYKLLDGNTRKAAHEINDDPFTDAYIVSGLADNDDAVYLSGSINNLGGVRPTKEERIKIVLAGKNRAVPFTDARISQETGLNANEIGRIFAEYTFNRRARTLGLPQDLPQGHKVALSKVADDAVLMNIVKLASEASLRTPEVKTLIGKTAAETSEAARLKVLADERQALQPVITQIAQGHSATAPPSRDSLMAFGRLYSLRQQFPDVHDWVPMRQESRTEWLDKIKVVRDFLDDLAKAYEAAGVTPNLFTAQAQA